MFSELVDIQSTFTRLFGSFLGTLGSLFLIFRGPGAGLNFDDFLGIPWGSPG